METRHPHIARTRIEEVRDYLRRIDTDLKKLDYSAVSGASALYDIRTNVEHIHNTVGLLGENVRVLVDYYEDRRSANFVFLVGFLAFMAAALTFAGAAVYATWPPP